MKEAAMRSPIFAGAAVCLFAISPAKAGDAIAGCKDFFAKFEKCADALQGNQQDEARVYIKTMRGILGMNDSLNQGDPMLIGMMCSGMMDEMKKDPDIKKYNCQW